MIQKMSVRKPFTVLVMVILITVLGVVSFMNTTTDLIPSINLPYAIIVTQYGGATPEQVEADVTTPIEGRMATISGIQQVTSTSSEHVSMVFLEFTDSTNMDFASIEIREAIDMITLPDGAAKPFIMRLNPDMMPVMVASVFAEGLNMSELSDFTKNRVVPAFEAVPGVASVSTSGLLQNQVYIILSESKTEQVQAAIKADIDAAMEAAIAQFTADAIAAATEAAAAEMEARAAEQITELVMQGMPPEDAEALVMQQMLEMQSQDFDMGEFDMSEFDMSEFGDSGEFGEMGDFGDMGNMDFDEMIAQMLSIETIQGILFAQNFAMPAGFIDDDGEDLMLRVGDRLGSADDVKNLLLFEMPLGELGTREIRLSDVADIIITDNGDTLYTRVNGSPAVMITIQKQTEFSTSDLSNRINAEMERLTSRNSDIGLEFAVLMDQGHYIDIIVDSILRNLIYGGLLAVIILLIFLRDLRPTLIVSISIPVSLMLAFSLMYFTGISLNIISMSGLALGVGMLVDNSIVVIDNIFRLRNEGLATKRAAVQGAGEVASAITASTLTTIAVFLPIVFTQGLTRQLFTDLGLTIAYSLLASLLIALTVIPAASSGMFRKMKPKDSKFFSRIADFYTKLLRGALKAKIAIVLVTMAATVLSGWVVYSKGTEFFPSMDSEEISVNVGLEDGTSFEDAVKIAEALSAHITTISDIEHVGVNVSSGGMMGMIGEMFGMGSMGGGGDYGVDIYLLLVDSSERTMSNYEISEKIMQKEAELGVEINVTYDSGAEMSMLTGDAISVRITGRELDNIRDTALDVAEIIRGVPGAINIDDGSDEATPELRVRVDKDAAMAKGLTTAQVYMAAMEAVANPETKMSMSFSGHDYQIIIQDSDWVEPGREAIENLEIISPQGEIVILGDIAEVYDDVGFSSISRIDGARTMSVRGEIEHGYNVGLVNAEIERLLADYTPHEGCTVSVRGEAESIATAFRDLYLMLLLALIFIYLIMVAQFQSLLSPFIVMFTIPLAFTGGFVALLITDMLLSIVAMIGLILLTGVIVNNGVVFIDCVNRLRREGYAKKDALVEAGRIRLRPILMTALTTIAAMSTMTIGMGVGTEMVQPMAVTVVGGLIYATLMTLFVVPCMYDLLHRNRDMTRSEDLDYDRFAEENAVSGGTI
ncbi:MAG: efflux RND transporter permease subunit [Oscillospiraceae bacterium]|nr:efflux RND transporter permease subunit [Oscillospiraceae bacterium]